MPGLRSTMPLVLLAAALTAGTCNSARATLIWNGDAANGTSVFKQINIDGTNSSVSVVTDATYGKVFKFDKGAGDDRCEAHGAAGFTPVIGATYFIGWRSKVTDLTDNHATFQWKTYGDPNTQNHPLMLSIKSGALRLAYYKPGDIETSLWSQSCAANKWYSHVVVIHVSDSATAGWIEYYFGSGIETLSNGSTIYHGRTFDGSSVDPKWGVYGADTAHVINYVGQLKIGTTYNDVAP